MKRQSRSLKGRGVATLIAALIMAVLGLRPSDAAVHERSDGDTREPIVGLWQATIKYGDTVLENVISAWTSDGLEVEDYALPILEGHICYGHWIKLQGRTYGQTHPYFEYDPKTKTGEWAGTSGVINYTVTVSKDGKTYSGTVSGKSGVPGPNPYVDGGTSYGGLTITATKVGSTLANCRLGDWLGARAGPSARPALPLGSSSNRCL
jgi:hypothetical protein